LFDHRGLGGVIRADCLVSVIRNERRGAHRRF
jgi:hypothetical protein